MSIASEIARIKSAKDAIRSALIAKGVSVSELDALDSYAAKIEGIATGIDTSDATATNADILSGKTAYVKGSKITGNISSKGAATYNPSTTAQEIASGQYLSGKQTIAAVTASNIPSTLKETKSVTPTKSEQTINATSGKVMTSVNVGAIPSEYIIPSGSQTITENGTFDVTALASVIVNVATGGGGGLPTGISKLDFGTINVTSAIRTTATKFNHNLGVVPDFVMVYAPENVAQTYSMLMAMRGNILNWRSGYNSYYFYHGNSTSTVTITNNNNATYGVGGFTTTQFAIASQSTSYYWRVGTYNYIAIKF